MKSVFWLIPLLLVSCAYNKEMMTRPDGSTYLAQGIYVGGEHDTRWSSGAQWTHSLSASFKDLMQTIATVSASVASFKASAASEVTKRVDAKELTVRQGQQLQFEIQKIQTEADVAKFMAALAAE
jgi:alpha-ketoglutarate-dependent taurine dioxygenase